MWRLVKLGYRHEPRLMLTAFLLSQLSALPDALLALWLMLLGKGVLESRPGLVRAAALGLGVSATATWFLSTVSTRVQRRFRDKVTIALESHVARLQASVATIGHHERPEYLDRLAMLRDQVFVLDHMYMSLFSTCGWILRLGVTVALLASIHPALVLLAVFASPTVVTSTWRPAVERVAQERAAPHDRLARHLFTTATTAPPGKEVRVTGIGDRLVTQRRGAWERGYALVSRSRRLGLWHTLAWAVFGPPTWCQARRTASRPAETCSRTRGRLAPSAYVGATVGELDSAGFWMDETAPRLARGLRRLAESADASRRLRQGIRLEHVSSPTDTWLVPTTCRSAPRGRRRRHRGERRRQEHPGQAPGQDVRACLGLDSGGRHSARASPGR
jgi:ATP-binding cassette subfamily B protein